MPDAVQRLIYFLLHPSEYLGLWTLDLTIATLGIVLRQLQIMQEQTTLMKRQTTILTAQDELNRALLARRIRLHVYGVESPSKIDLYLVNTGARMAQKSYCHLYIPDEVIKTQVWYGAGKAVVPATGSFSIEGQTCRHHVILVGQSVFPSREIHLAQFTKNNPMLPMWWKAVSEDGVEPLDGMQRVELRPSPTLGAIDADT